MPAGVFASAFEGAHNVFGERRILGDSFTDENSRESEIAGVCRIGGAQNARFKNGFGGELAADACGNQRVRVECGEVAGIDACDDCLGGCITESGCHNGKLAEIVSFADFNECLNAELLRALSHLYELGVVEDAGDE